MQWEKSAGPVAKLQKKIIETCNLGFIHLEIKLSNTLFIIFHLISFGETC